MNLDKILGDVDAYKSSIKEELEVEYSKTYISLIDSLNSKRVRLNSLKEIVSHEDPSLEDVLKTISKAKSYTTNLGKRAAGDKIKKQLNGDMHFFSDSKEIDDFLSELESYDNFKNNVSVPNSLKKINCREFEVEIGTDFRRCTECNSLINRYRDFLDGNIIEENKGCTFEGRKKNFCYEDHFD